MRALLITALAALMTLTAPVAAFAQTVAPPDSDVAFAADVDDVKERAQAAIDWRLETIERLRNRITSHPHVTGAHQGQLLGELGRSEAGLNALAAEIRQAETIEELRVLVPKIATDFRIYLVVAPTVNQVLASDTVVAVGNRLDEAADVLAGWIERAANAGIDVADAERHLADMIAETAAGVGLGAPVAGSVLPLTPEDWPNPASDVLAAGRADLIEARELLRVARESAREALASLREALGK